eukprot:scaffold2237_cov175-Ochromonas_danica.AAC.1
MKEAAPQEVGEGWILEGAHTVIRFQKKKLQEFRLCGEVDARERATKAVVSSATESTAQTTHRPAAAAAAAAHIG